MSTIEKVCSTCKHEPRDENCLGCTFDWKNADGNTHWEPKEPFINKPCVSEQACHEDKMKVLEKIKAEIRALSPKPTAYDVIDGNHIKEAVWETLVEVLQVINKYMVESEDKE